MSAGPLPGLDAMGCGYQTITGQFASIDSCVSQLFDFDKIGTKELFSPATGKTYMFPKSFVQYLDRNARESSIVSGENVEDYVKKLSASVEIGANYEAFSGSVKTKFNNASEFSRFEAYTRYQYTATLWKLSLDETAGNHRDFLKESVRNAIDKLNPIDLLDMYGTHYVDSIQVGGRCIYSAVTNKLKTSKTQSLGLYLQTKFEIGAFGTSATSKVTEESDYKSFSQNSRFMTKVTGGDPAEFGNDSAPQLDKLAKTVASRPMMVDFDHRKGLVPLWTLASTEGRRTMLKNAMDDYFENHKTNFDMDHGAPLQGRWVEGHVQFRDKGSHAHKYFAVYKPDIGDGWQWLGQRGFGPESDDGHSFQVLAVREKPWARGVLSSIKDFDQIWNDKGSHNGHDYNIWRPIADDPINYRSLGSFFKTSDNDGQAKPAGSSIEGLVAVHQDLIEQASVGKQLWNDEGTHADLDGSCWKIDVPCGGVDCGLFVGSSSHNKPSNGDVFCLKKSAIDFI